MASQQEVLKRILEETRGERPHYERYALTVVPGTVEEAFGLQPHGPSLKGELGLPQADVVLCVLIDGVGYKRLEGLRTAGLVDLSPFAHSGSYIPLTSVFPTTTTTALSTLSTGLSPIRHGVLGYKLFIPEVGAVVDMIRLSVPGGKENAIEKLGLNPEALLPGPTLYQRLANAGIPTVLFLPRFIAESGLSRALYQGVARTVPFLAGSDLVMLIEEALTRPGPAFLSVYWPSTDTLGHTYGPASPAVGSEIAHTFNVVRQIAHKMPKKSLLIVLSDHGQYEADPVKDMVNCAAQAALREALLLPPVGDPRAAYMFVRRGREEAVAEFFHKFFPEEFTVLSTEEALGRKLWGLEEAKPEVRALLGDLVVISRKRRFVLWPTEEFKLRGLHGGLTTDELFVPLLVWVP